MIAEWGAQKTVSRSQRDQRRKITFMPTHRNALLPVYSVLTVHCLHTACMPENSTDVIFDSLTILVLRVCTELNPATCRILDNFC